MGDRRFTLGLKTTDLCFGRLVGLRHTPMLTLVLDPRVHEKCLEPAAGNGSVLENTPPMGAVALPFGSNAAQCLKKCVPVFRSDMVFDGHQHGAAILADFGGHHRFRGQCMEGVKSTWAPL